MRFRVNMQPYLVRVGRLPHEVFIVSSMSYARKVRNYRAIILSVIIEGTGYLRCVWS